MSFGISRIAGVLRMALRNADRISGHSKWGVLAGALQLRRILLASAKSTRRSELGTTHSAHGINVSTIHREGHSPAMIESRPIPPYGFKAMGRIPNNKTSEKEV